jgi:hypothetical protein
MAQADSVPTAISRPITGAISKASTNRGSADRLCLSRGLPPIETEAASVLELWRQISRRADVDNPVEAQNRRRRETITGRMTLGWYIVAITYATAVILLGPWPWNLLLILSLLLSRDEVLRYGILNRWGSSS